MKKFLFPALALGLVMTSCQSDEPFAPGMGEEVQATFTISVPDAMGTRAADHSSAEGGFTNRAGQLNYTVALLNQENKVMYSATSAGNGTSATFSPTVVSNYKYKILAYATFGNEAVVAPEEGQTISDTDAINNIVTLKGINDESEDAYFCNDTITGAPNMAATLKRPFGKLRLVATDCNKLQDLGLDVKSVKVTYGENVVMEQKFDTFNKAFEVEGGAKEWSADKATYAEAATNELTVFVDYLPAGNGETMYPFTIEVTYNDNKTVYTRTFAQDIPVKRNYLTTLRGDFFTTEAALTLKVEEMFENSTELDAKYTYFTVDTNDELKAALTSNHEHIYVELDADLAVDVTAWETLAFGGDKTKSITINGEQVVTRGATPTLTFNHLNGDWNNIATKNGAKLILKNLNVTNSGNNNGPWNRHDLNFACDVEMTNVISDKAIALKAGGVLKNVTINDKNTSGTYALWIQPKGQVVTLEDCTIDMLDCTDGRGIKIDEQYMAANEVKAPTLNVSGTTFKTEKKAAVVVKSVAGALINWGERNDISKVAADSTFAVWVDEASAAYADNVIVNGASARIEGSIVVKTADELVAALETDKDVYLLNDIKIDPANMSNAYGKTGVLVYNGQTIDGNGFKLDVKGAGGTWDSGICTSGGLIKDLWVTGGFRGIFVKGADHIEKVVLENVRVEGTTYTISIDQASGQGLEATNSIFRGWTSYAGTIGNVKFTGCTFGAGNGYNFSRPYAPTEYVGCNFEEGHEMDPRAAVTFENCTINGVALTAENISTLVTSNIANATVK